VSKPVKLLDAGYRERAFGLAVWDGMEHEGLALGTYPFWRFLEEATYDPLGDEIYWRGHSWRVEVRQ
jgi:hypothetical protein